MIWHAIAKKVSYVELPVVAILKEFRRHNVAPSLREIPIALIHGVNALRHRALAASGCPGPKVCRQCPAIEGCSTRST